MTVIVTILLTATAALAVAQVARPGTLSDRVIGFDAVLWALASLVAVDAAITGDTASLDIPLIIALLGVLGTVTAAEWLRRRGTSR